ncbi:unnamed protein product [Cylicocyclus nassatus]|uniref:Uncharacterized protein n=1 Tax=Cylicocyclus nassatus TaxID=53992 RepID=A0AA36GTD7_CYLNA|nr:unnamed protein product [Cylicocyclus nassatus]
MSVIDVSVVVDLLIAIYHFIIVITAAESRSNLTLACYRCEVCACSIAGDLQSLSFFSSFSSTCAPLNSLCFNIFILDVMHPQSFMQN